MHNSTRVHDGRKRRTFSNAFAVVGRRDECLLCDPELGYKTGRELEKKRTEEGMKKYGKNINYRFNQGRCKPRNTLEINKTLRTAPRFLRQPPGLIFEKVSQCEHYNHR